jgi:hypothetical protein
VISSPSSDSVQSRRGLYSSITFGAGMARRSQSVSCVGEDGAELRDAGNDLSDCGGAEASRWSSYNNSKSSAIWRLPDSTAPTVEPRLW